ncbi:hypothetical protein [Streptomyces sp. ATCC 21386]|uniref:hypothetical protein n=1 Tax=Streptomyces sp. ATCC 21386 TaxID=2699428 RepID=UPI001BFEF8DF
MAVFSVMPNRRISPQTHQRLSLAHCDVPAHLRTSADTYDVLYSVFGAVDFTEPRELLPAALSALRPGGRLVFATLAHHLGGAPAHPRVRHTEIGAKTPDGTVVLMRRWVLQEPVWIMLLDEAGFTQISTEVLPGGPGTRAADTLLVTAFQRVVGRPSDAMPYAVGPAARDIRRFGRFVSRRPC